MHGRQTSNIVKLSRDHQSKKTDKCSIDKRPWRLVLRAFLT